MSHWVTVFRKKELLHWVTVFNKQNICHTESKQSKNVNICQKRSKMDRFWQFMTIFDRFSLNTVTQCDKHFFYLTQWPSVTFFSFFLNTLTQCDKHFFKHINLFLAVNLFSEKNCPFCYLSKTNFNIQEKLIETRRGRSRWWQTLHR